MRAQAGAVCETGARYGEENRSRAGGLGGEAQGCCFVALSQPSRISHRIPRGGISRRSRRALQPIEHKRRHRQAVGTSERQICGDCT